MRKLKGYAIWTMAALLSVYMIGCGCKNGDCGIGVEATPLPSIHRPTVTFVTPFNSETGVPINRRVAATFSEAMDPTTISAATFTVTGPGAAQENGTVTYDTLNHFATFTPASNLLPSTTYIATITIGAKNPAGVSLAVPFVWSFTTGVTPDTTSPTVIFANPADLATGVPINTAIIAAFSEAMDPATITATNFTLMQGATPISGTVTYLGGIATFTPSSPLTPSTTYTATIVAATDLAGNDLVGGSVPNPWTFTTGATPDTTPPTVTLANPVNLTTGAPISTTVTATFSEAMDPFTITTANFVLTEPDGTPVTGIVSYNVFTNMATFTPSSPLAPLTTFTATITTAATDLAGNPLVGGLVPNPWTFTTGTIPDTTRPTVTFVTPANFATGVPINTTIVTATFSEAMNPATISATSFKLTGPGATPVTGNVTYNTLNHIAIFTLASNLLSNTTYTATITTGAKDLAGNALLSNYVWSFTTSAAADVTPPTVILVTPANLSTGAPINTAVTAAFSEAMDPATITTTTFTLKQGATTIAGTVTYMGLIATFKPSSPLSYNTVYTATITTGAKDLAGNALAGGLVPNPWTFTTGAAPDTTRPTVILVNPANLSTGVPTNTAVAAAFSEAMDPTTITTATFTLKQGATVISGTVTYLGLVATFKPSSPLAPFTTYTATITTGATDLAGNALAGGLVPNPWTFTTGATPDTTPPTVILVNPANLATGAPINTSVTATFSEAMDPTTITIVTFTLKQGATTIPGTVTYLGLIATFKPSSPLNNSTVYTATITTGAKDLAGNALGSDFIWSFTTGAAPDTTRPTVVLVAPVNLATGVPLNTAVAATFSEAMDPATIITATTFTLKQGATTISGAVTYVGRIATFKPSSPLAPLTTYTATITTGAKDLAGNALLSNYVWSFTTGATPDTTRPTVISVTPANLATGVPINTAVNATFSEAMDPATIITATTFTLKQGATAISGTVTYVGLIATFTPSSPLNNTTVYTATITTAAKDLAGNALLSNYVWSFTTGAAADTTRPTVISVTPANLATGVPINTAVNATFSEAMDPATIISANFELTGPGITPVIGIVGYNTLTDIATFTPSSPLAANTTYTATITTGAQDLAGNTLLSNYVWSFTTAAAVVTGPLPVDLGAAANFAILAGGGISSVPTSAITGNIGVSPASGSFITGLTCPEVNGTIYTVDAAGPACAVIDPAGLTAAKAALTVAFNDAAGRSVPAPATISGDQGGITLPPGIYKSTSSLSIASGNLTLDGQGDANAVWIFQIASTLTTVGCGASVPCTTGGNVMLINGANAANVFWQVGTSATIGQFTAFEGTILAYVSISINTGAQITGRLLSGAQPSGDGAVTLISDTVTLP